MDEIRKIIGQKLCIGFDGPEITPEFRDLVRTYKIGNVILFRRNAVSPDQLRHLNRTLKELILQETGIPALIAIDEECGKLSRLDHIGLKTPDAMEIGTSGDPSKAYEIASAIGAELKDFGIGMNLAPVLDVNSNPKNPVIGVRSFGTDPQTVSGFGIAYMLGLRNQGILSCGKHFPGHGDTDTDSHIGLPVVRKTREEMEKTELSPFRSAIAEGIDAIMSAHVVFPALEPEGLPSTLSRRVITGLLRQEMNFSGVIISDCMEMDAVRTLYGTPVSVLKGMQAGIDIALICHTPERQLKSAELLEKAYRDGSLSLSEARESLQRILRMKSTLQTKMSCL